jgi:trehalose synthase
LLHRVDLGDLSIEPYREIVGDDEIARLRRLAEPLRGLKLLHLNATSYGGGVSELLRSVVPLERDLGIEADWRIIAADDAFFNVTKKMHNALQGEEVALTSDQVATYNEVSARNAGLLEADYDVYIVHDPQPLAVRHYLKQPKSHWIWRCHIDTAGHSPDVWALLEPFVAEYDAAIFTLRDFVPPRFPVERVGIIPPAIDPLSPKNMELPRSVCESILGWIGIDIDDPLVAQVSRFDPWKDPLGVLAAYRMVRAEVPRLQLAMVGSMAMDDPQGWEIYRELTQAAESDPLVHIFTNLTGVGNVEVNAFQRLSQVVIQKSIREGFGLVVSEALWKGTPVVAGKAGGLPLQMPVGVGGYLVETVEDAAERILQLLRDRERAKQLGELGRQHVKGHFLLPRMIADELRLIADVVGRDGPGDG